ncbi:hypothetical protein [Gramella sp. AN32]|uniref:YncE family protein n=1 Tax=Christiangramia antarctica TaxID=2058158 RepID=A0ABW5X4C7_9FLAO|nr:hypothetical protein [Gramella sp. AN32]
MSRFVMILLLSLMLFSCNEENKKWSFEKKIELPAKARPLAIAKTGNDLWFSDPDHYRLIKIDAAGRVLDSIVDIQRPMNIDFNNGKLYVPEFLTDTIWIFEDGGKSPLSLNAKPAAPAGLNV